MSIKVAGLRLVTVLEISTDLIPFWLISAQYFEGNSRNNTQDKKYKLNADQLEVKKSCWDLLFNEFENLHLTRISFQFESN